VRGDVFGVYDVVSALKGQKTLEIFVVVAK
jgi:hypothetical protein